MKTRGVPHLPNAAGCIYPRWVTYDTVTRRETVYGKRYTHASDGSVLVDWVEIERKTRPQKTEES